LSRIATRHGAIVTTSSLVTVAKAIAAAPADNIIVVRDW
jgi:hypothetical protein